MGFDQYHEPPDELPADARTFARLCASLTEEAGLYLEERFSFRVATDEAAVALVTRRAEDVFGRASCALP